MPYLRSIFAALAFTLLLSSPVAAEVLYLCSSYNGQQNFWSKTACSQQRATAKRSFDIPAGLSMQEQVARAEAQLSSERRATLGTPGLTGIVSGPVPGSEAECDAQRREIKRLEGMRAWVNPPMSRDAIASELNIRKDRVSQLRCR